MKLLSTYVNSVVADIPHLLNVFQVLRNSADNNKKKHSSWVNKVQHDVGLVGVAC